MATKKVVTAGQKAATGHPAPARRAPARRAAGKKGRERRQQIIDAAKELLVREGPDRLVLRDLANRLGITHGNLQYYFPTKNDLMVAIFDQQVEKYTGGMRAAVAETSTRRGRLDAIIDSALEELKSPETALWRTMMSLADHNPDLAAILKRENDLYDAVLAEELKFVAPDLPAQRRLHLARIVRVILDGLGVQGGYEDPGSPQVRALASEIKSALFAILDLD